MVFIHFIKIAYSQNAKPRNRFSGLLRMNGLFIRGTCEQALRDLRFPPGTRMFLNTNLRFPFGKHSFSKALVT